MVPRARKKPPEPPGTAVQRHAVVERHLEKYPWSRLSDAPPSDASQLELRLLLDAAGAEGRAWLVSGTQVGRLPGPFEADLYIAICQLYNSQIPRDRRRDQRSVRTTYAELAQLMGRERGGTTYKSIRIALERLKGVEIRSVRTWRTGKHGAREALFNLFASVEYDYGRAKPTGKAADGGELPVLGITVTFSEELADSLAEGNLRVLDTARYFALETPTAKRLFRFLDQRRWFGDQIQQELLISFAELVERLPIDRSSPSHVKRTLDPAHAGLVANGYLSSAEYEERPVPGRKRKEPWVRYRFADARATPATAVALVQESASVAEPPAFATSLSASVASALRSASSDASTPREHPDGLRDLVAEIMGTLRDDHSLPFYVKVAKAMPEEALRNVLGGVRQSIREGVSLDVARKIFTSTVMARARAMKIAL